VSPARFAAGHYLSAVVDGEVFLVHKDSGDSFRIGGSGGRLWSLISAGMPVDDAAATVARETKGSVEQVTADMQSLVAKLEEIGALVRLPG
jgi:hypothetical protein